MQNSAIHHRRQYDWLKQYHWQKGQSGNPSGKTSKKLKTFVAETLSAMNDEQKAEYLKTIDPEIAWRMGEGNPHSTDTVVTMNISDVLKELNENVRIERQNLAAESSLPDTGQTETITILPEERSPEPLRTEPLVEKYNPEV